MTRSRLRALILGAVASPVLACGTSNHAPTDSVASSAGGAAAGGGASTGGSSAGANGGAAGTNGGGYLSCDAPVPVKIGGVDTGYVQCAQGSMHRPSAVQCPSAVPRPSYTCVGFQDGGVPACTTDADCVAMPNGWCQSPSQGAPSTTCECDYGCRADADCAAGEICLCGDPVGHCVSATCTTDADCPSGALCLSYDTGCEGSPAVYQFACQTTSDTCVGGKQCTMGLGAQCSPAVATTTRSCHPGCIAGRPLVVRGAAMVAALARRSAWVG